MRQLKELTKRTLRTSELILEPHRYLAFVESLHTWLYEHCNDPSDSQPKHIIDRLLRGLENHVEWYISDGMIKELNKLSLLTKKNNLIDLLMSYDGNQITRGPVGKIRQLGKNCSFWKHWTDEGFPCVEHVRPISEIRGSLINSHPDIYKKRYHELSLDERVVSAVNLLNVMKKSPICLVTRSEDRRILKNKRGQDPWSSYNIPKKGTKINRKLIRNHDLPCKEDLLVILS